jgi:hypothetical protein
MTGLELCSLSRESFLAMIPDCAGDILYEHLQVLWDCYDDIKDC